MRRFRDMTFECCQGRKVRHQEQDQSTRASPRQQAAAPRAATILSEDEIETDAVISEVVDKNRQQCCKEMGKMGKGCAGSAVLLLTPKEKSGSIRNIV